MSDTGCVFLSNIIHFPCKMISSDLVISNVKHITRVRRASGFIGRDPLSPAVGGQIELKIRHNRMLL